MYIVIVGAGGIGRRLTEIALRDGRHNVIVIDKDQASNARTFFNTLILDILRQANEYLDKL